MVTTNPVRSDAIPVLNTNVSDPVGDMLTRIRNANIAFKEELFLPASKQNEAICKILQEEGYITSFKREGEGVRQVLRVPLKYGKDRPARSPAFGVCRSRAGACTPSATTCRVCSAASGSRSSPRPTAS